MFVSCSNQSHLAVEYTLLHHSVNREAQMNVEGSGEDPEDMTLLWVLLS